jgi:hypothetical protein
MLDRITLWVDVVAAAADVLLLARVLQLRLQRVYLFITLACALSVFFDGVQLWFGLNSHESMRIGLYSRFLYALVYPLAAWDVFEEMTPQIAQLRRTAAGRLITGLFLAALFGFIMSLFITSEDNNNQSIFSNTLAFVLWAGSTTATLGFLWTLQRALKAQNIARPNNTFVWMTFYQLTMLAEIVACFGGMLVATTNATVAGVLDICLLVYGLIITVWCTTKLKRIPSDVSTTTAQAGAA